MLEGVIFMLCLTDDDDPLTCAGIFQVKLQTMARELQLLDLLFELLHEVTRIQEQNKAKQVDTGNMADTAETNLVERQLLTELIALMYRAITFCFKEHSDNENYVATTKRVLGVGAKSELDTKKDVVADSRSEARVEEGTFLSKIIADVVHHNDAAECLTALVTNNRRLLETVAWSMMFAFVDLIRTKGPQHQLLRFLEGLASCAGEQIIENQERLLQLYLSHGKLVGRKRAWQRHRLLLAIETVLVVSRGDPDAAGNLFPGEREGHNNDSDSTILVSWFSDPDWQPDTEHFYFSYGKLGLNPVKHSPKISAFHEYLKTIPEKASERQREWVSLEDVAVAVDEEQDPEVVNLISDLLKYYEAQIDLFAEMLLGRSYNCILALEAQFSFSLCIRAIRSTKLPDSLRSSFTKMLTRLYIDRYPHSQIAVPRRVQDLSTTRKIRVRSQTSTSKRKSFVATVRGTMRDQLSAASDNQKTFTMKYQGEKKAPFDALPQFSLPDGHLSLEKAGENSFFACSNAGKFLAVQELIVDWFTERGGQQVLVERHRNELSLSLLRLSLWMMHMGFYGRVNSIRSLCWTLLATLDGRGDTYSEDIGDRTIKRNNDSDDPRRPSIHLEDHGVVDNPMMKATGLFVEQQEPQPVIQESGERYHMSASNSVIMESKKNICDVLMFVSNLQLDFRLNRLLYTFAKHGDKLLVYDGNGLSGFFGLDNGSSTLTRTPKRTQQVRGPYEDAPSHTKALSHTVMQTHCQLTQFASEEIQKLFKDEENEVGPRISILEKLFDPHSQSRFKVLNLDSMGPSQSPLVPVLLDLMMYRNIADLKEDIESFEIWGLANAFGGKDTGKYQHVLDALRFIRDLCLMENKQPHQRNQQLLRKLDAHQVIFASYQLDVKHQSDHRDNDIIEDDVDEGEGNEMTTEIKHLCNSFTIAFCMANERNQQLFSDQLPLLLRQIRETTELANEVPQVVKGLYTANISLCALISEHKLDELIDAVSTAIKKKRFRAATGLIEALQLLVRPHKTAEIIRHNAQRILDKICDRQELVAEATAAAEVADSELKCHVQLLHLLALICNGRGITTKSEAKVRHLLPLDLLLRVLLDEDVDSTYETKAAYASLLFHAFCDSEIDTTRLLFDDEAVFEFFQIATEEIAMACDEANASQRYYVAVGLLPLCDWLLVLWPELELEEEEHEIIQALKDRREAIPYSTDEWSGSTSTPPPQHTKEPKMGPKEGRLQDYKALCQTITHDPKLAHQMRSSYELFLQCLWEVQRLTDPEDEHFKSAKASRQLYYPFGYSCSFLGKAFAWDSKADKRSLKITREALFKRMVDFLQAPDSEGSERVKLLVLRAMRESVQTEARRFHETGEDSAGDRERDDAKKAFQERQAEVAEVGAVRVIVDLLIAATVGTSDGTRMVMAVLRLANALLEGGNRKVQDAIHRYARYGTSGGNFFEALHAWLRVSVRAKAETRGRNELQPDDPIEKWERSARPSRRAPDEEETEEDTDDDEDTEEDIVFSPLMRFLQLWCENHNEDVQNALREQRGYRRSGPMFDIVTLCVNSLGELGTTEQEVRRWTRSHVEVAVPLLQFCLECAQGPCKRNQELLSKSVLVDCTLAVMSAHFKPFVEELRLVEVVQKARRLIKRARARVLAAQQTAHITSGGVWSRWSRGSRGGRRKRVGVVGEMQAAREALVGALRSKQSTAQGLEDAVSVLALSVDSPEELREATTDPERFVTRWRFRLAKKAQEVQETLRKHGLRSFQERLVGAQLHTDGDPSALTEGIVTDLMNVFDPDAAGAGFARGRDGDGGGGGGGSGTRQRLRRHDAAPDTSTSRSDSAQEQLCAMVWAAPIVLDEMHSAGELLEAVQDPNAFANRRPVRLTQEMTKQLKANAVKALTSLLEGRGGNRHNLSSDGRSGSSRPKGDFAIHEALAERIEPSLLKMRLVNLYQQFERLQPRHEPATGRCLSFSSSSRDWEASRDWDETFLDEACDLLTLVQRLNDFDDSFETRMEDDNDFEYTRTRKQLDKKLRTIEVVWAGRLTKVLFLLPSHSDYLDKAMKKQLLAQIDFTSEDKVKHFLFGLDRKGSFANSFQIGGYKAVTDQVLHEEQFSQYSFYRFSGQMLRHMKTLSFVLAGQMNLIMLLSLEVESDYDNNGNSVVVLGVRFAYSSMVFHLLVRFFGLIQLGNAVAILAFLLMKNVPVAFVRQKRNRESYQEMKMLNDRAAVEAMNSIFKTGARGVIGVGGLGVAGARGLTEGLSGLGTGAIGAIGGLGRGNTKVLTKGLSTGVSTLGASVLGTAKLGISGAKGLSGAVEKLQGKLDDETQRIDNLLVDFFFVAFFVIGSVFLLYLRFGPMMLVTLALAIWCLYKACNKLRELWARPTNALNFYYCIAFDLLSHPMHAFQIGYVASAAIAVGLDYPMLYSFQLLDLIVMSPILQNVVKAVTKSAKQLSMTLLLGVLTVYLFAGGAFFFLQGEMQDAESGQNGCRTLLLCFATVLRYGVLSGGGIGEYIDFEVSAALFPYNPDLLFLRPNHQLGNQLQAYGTFSAFAARYAFDLLFFVIVLILLLFGELRDKQTSMERQKRDFCFICDIEKQKFDDAFLKRQINDGFQFHCNNEHNMWDYLLLCIYLEHRDSSDYTGPESYLAKCISDGSLAWIPTRKATSLPDDMAASKVERLDLVMQEQQTRLEE
eukprot:g740.t1